ncbi:hypothetical protein GGTG_11244 [Gaeumannomyces tritici R3-111a-1]|uniref:Uncharacterized protein n=1 Tax=Gaeumannomyces tritici (strain R3-111a-1) TaxID=644352 RepID=J3PCM4_GAET3|nr:hypothetical protein GGTG_11244 [Gaeumannomyces tritici R3-111a-1]EJT71994.1 hypothetical protein GGTG_11244 [Gaeumannomyces tritici R3-111a-1]
MKKLRYLLIKYYSVLIRGLILTKLKKSCYKCAVNRKFRFKIIFNGISLLRCAWLKCCIILPKLKGIKVFPVLLEFGKHVGLFVLFAWAYYFTGVKGYRVELAVNKVALKQYCGSKCRRMGGEVNVCFKALKTVCIFAVYIQSFFKRALAIVKGLTILENPAIKRWKPALIRFKNMWFIIRWKMVGALIRLISITVNLKKLYLQRNAIFHSCFNFIRIKWKPVLKSILLYMGFQLKMALFLNVFCNFKANGLVGNFTGLKFAARFAFVRIKTDIFIIPFKNSNKIMAGYLLNGQQNVAVRI